MIDLHITEPLLTTAVEDFNWDAFSKVLLANITIPFCMIALTSTINPIVHGHTDIGLSLLGFQANCEKYLYFLSHKISDKNNGVYHDEHIKYD